MRAGKLRHRVTIQSRTVAADTVGHPVETWATLASVSADILPMGGAEPFHSDQFDARVSHDITIRYRTDVTPNMRVVWGSKTLDVEAVMDPDGRRRSLRILALERAD